MNALVCLDFQKRRAIRYWRVPGTDKLGTWHAELCAPEDQDATFPAVIEAFRRGPEKKRNVPMAGK